MPRAKTKDEKAIVAMAEKEAKAPKTPAKKRKTPRRKPIRAKESGYALLDEVREVYRKNPNKIVDAIYEHRGLVEYIARDLGTRRQTLNRFLNEEPELKEWVEDAREGLFDKVERGIFDIIDDPKHPKHALMLIYTSKTLLKHRGYIERPQDDRTYAPQINITVNTPWGSEQSQGEVVDAEVVTEIEGGAK